MVEEDEYLYRGTTRGWPGNECLRTERITCTTTDPLVATLFAIECRNRGPAVVLVARRKPFEGLIGPPNYFAIVECAVNVLVAPLDFASQAVLTLDVDQAITILGEMGFDRLPARISGQVALREALN
jgi:hypothetical protein